MQTALGGAFADAQDRSQLFRRMAIDDQLDRLGLLLAQSFDAALYQLTADVARDLLMRRQTLMGLPCQHIKVYRYSAPFATPVLVDKEIAGDAKKPSAHTAGRAAPEAYGLDSLEKYFLREIFGQLVARTRFNQLEVDIAVNARAIVAVEIGNVSPQNGCGHDVAHQ